MKPLRALLTAAVLGLPIAVSAAPITFRLTGHIDSVTTFPVPVVAGDTFSADVSFDSAAALLNQNRPGRYVYDPSSIAMRITLGAFGPFTPTFDPNQGGTLFVRNNSPFPSLTDPPVDGLTFGLTESDGPDSIISILFVMRSLDTSILSSGDVPTSLDPRLFTGFDHAFQVCFSSINNQGSCDRGQMDATIEGGQRVPEPPLTALLATGLVGLAWVRRRRR